VHFKVKFDGYIFHGCVSEARGFTGSRAASSPQHEKTTDCLFLFAPATLEGVMRAIPSWVDLGWVRVPSLPRPPFAFDGFFVCPKSGH